MSSAGRPGRRARPPQGRAARPPGGHVLGGSHRRDGRGGGPGPAPPRDRLFTFDDLSSFLGFLDWTCGLIRTPQLAAQVAYDYAARASADGIVYAEVIINPTHWAGWELGPLTDALAAGFERAESEGLASCNLLLSILRAQSADEAEALVEWMGAAARRGRRAVDRRRRGTVGPHRTAFASAYRRAGELGFGRTAHAGESSGCRRRPRPRSTCCTSTASITASAPSTTPELVRRLADEAVTLNVCLSSNLVHLYPDRSAHPFPALHAPASH